MKEFSSFDDREYPVPVRCRTMLAFLSGVAVEIFAEHRNDPGTEAA